MIIKVKVKPNSKKFEIKEGEVWQISLRASAENNKANLELIKEMKKRFGQCRIVKGLKSKTKIIEV